MLSSSQAKRRREEKVNLTKFPHTKKYLKKFEKIKNSVELQQPCHHHIGQKRGETLNSKIYNCLASQDALDKSIFIFDFGIHLYKKYLAHT